MDNFFVLGMDKFFVLLGQAGFGAISPKIDYFLVGFWDGFDGGDRSVIRRQFMGQGNDLGGLP